jgi:hypothetical protein
MTKEEIQNEMDQLKEAKQEVLLQLEKAAKETELARANIEELNGRLSTLLAGIALKRIPNSSGIKEIAPIKREKARQNRVIEDYPFLKAGLEAVRKEYSPHSFGMLQRKLDAWSEYERVKAEILAHPHDRHHHGREAKLLRLAAHPDLNLQSETEAFLKDLQERREKAQGRRN